MPFCSRQRPAIAMNGASFSVNRCFVFGDLAPVNSKNAEAGIRQRLLLSSRRPSERKLKTGPPRGPVGWKLKFIGTRSIPLPTARMTGPKSLILMSSARGRSSSLCWVGMPSSSAANLESQKHGVGLAPCLPLQPDFTNWAQFLRFSGRLIAMSPWNRKAAICANLCSAD